MKEYKIDLSMLEGEAREDVSAAIQRHAFRLGYRWIDTGTKLFACPTLSVIYFTKTGTMHGSAYTGKPILNKISITDFLALKPEDVKDAPEFRPFDRVLVRDSDGSEWRIDLFESFSADAQYRFQCLGSCWEQCVHYEGNEHLLGTKEDVK